MGLKIDKEYKKGELVVWGSEIYRIAEDSPAGSHYISAAFISDGKKVKIHQGVSKTTFSDPIEGQPEVGDIVTFRISNPQDFLTGAVFAIQTNPPKVVVKWTAGSDRFSYEFHQIAIVKKAVKPVPQMADSDLDCKIVVGDIVKVKYHGSPVDGWTGKVAATYNNATCATVQFISHNGRTSSYGFSMSELTKTKTSSFVAYEKDTAACDVESNVQVKENSMKPITVETRVFVNNTDVTALDNPALYGLISDQEKEIDRLNAIKNKPNRLNEEIKKRQEGIDALVKLLNERDAKK